MKCKAMQESWLRAMLAIGLVLLAAGVIWMFGFGAGDGLPARMAGFLSGLGGSMAAIGGGLMLLRRLSGEVRTRQRMLHMEDERGLAVAYKAQSAAAIAAVFSLIVLLMVALVRGDSLYITLGTLACFVICVVKFVAWYLYDKRM